MSLALKSVALPALVLAGSAWIAASPAPAQTGDQAEVAARLSAPIRIERAGPAASVPLVSRGDKLFIEAAVNGETREFFFDTGSPTILSRQLADALGLTPIGQSTGVDANGTPVNMEIAVADRIAIGGTVFHDVPVLIHDFSALDTGSCLMEGGVIGSEILPGSVWRIDTETGRLSIAAAAADLPPSPATLTATLHDFGYPHMPIVDYSVGEISDKALFDTGSAEALTLFAPLTGNPSVQALIVPGSTRTGQGYEGESAGGFGEAGPLVRYTLDGLLIDGQPLGPLRGTARSVPPTLVGYGLLDRAVVTLDYPQARFELAPRDQPARPEADAGYALALSGGVVRVARLFNGSAAAQAGLTLGDEVTAIDGDPLDTSEAGRCDTVRWLTSRFDAASVRTLTVRRAGETVALDLAATD